VQGGTVEARDQPTITADQVYVSGGTIYVSTPAEASRSILGIFGNYKQTGGWLVFGFSALPGGKVENDQLIVNQTVQLGGTVALFKSKAPELAVGKTFDIIKYGSLVGDFTNAPGPISATGSKLGYSLKPKGKAGPNTYQVTVEAKKP